VERQCAVPLVQSPPASADASGSTKGGCGITCGGRDTLPGVQHSGSHAHSVTHCLSPHGVSVVAK
jgi:hypothetical protein